MKAGSSLFLFYFLVFQYFNAFAQNTNIRSEPFYKEYDFSLAGYHLGKELPSRNISGKKIFRVVDYGALPDDGKDDIEAIQAAVNAAEKAGGGVVTFPQGVFDFDVETSQQFVHVGSSHIILRGYGEGVDGTILHDHRASHSPDPEQKWRGGVFPSFFKVGTPLKNLDSLLVARLEDAPMGSSQLTCQPGTVIEPGMYALLQTNPPDSSLVKELIFPLKKPGANHAKTEAKFIQLVRVTQVSNQKIQLDAPINWRLLQKWNPRLTRLPTLIEESGIENFRLVTDWKETFYHHKDDIHDSGWDHIKLYGVENGWVRNIVHDSPSCAISLNWCKNSVVYDCQIIGNRGHNGFQANGASTRNLFFNLKGGAAMHTYSLNGFSSGNVFHNCFTTAASSVDCHGSLCLFNLFDNIYGAVVQNGGGPGSMPPAHAHGLVLYNFNTGLENPYNSRIVTNLLKVSSYPGLKVYGLRSLLGYDISIEDESGKKRITDFETPFVKVSGFNSTGRMDIPSIYIWQHQQRYKTPMPEEPLKKVQDGE